MELRTRSLGLKRSPAYLKMDSFQQRCNEEEEKEAVAGKKIHYLQEAGHIKNQLIQSVIILFLALINTIRQLLQKVFRKLIN